VSPAENSEAIDIPFAFRTRLGPGKDLLHIADCFGRILYCVHSTQYSLLVTFGVAFHIFVALAGNCRHFELGVLVEHSQSQPTDDKLSLKGVWSLSRDLFNFFKICDNISKMVQESLIC